MPKKDLTPEQTARLAVMDDDAQQAKDQLMNIIAKADGPTLVGILVVQQFIETNWRTAGWKRLGYILRDDAPTAIAKRIRELDNSGGG